MKFPKINVEDWISVGVKEWGQSVTDQGVRVCPSCMSMSLYSANIDCGTCNKKGFIVWPETICNKCGKKVGHPINKCCEV